MKKIFLAMAALVCSMSMSAQLIKVYKDGSVVKTYTAEEADSVVFAETPAKTLLLPGKFSVTSGKKVQFTTGNLYWDGSEFKMEENQTDYPTTWDTHHVGHFHWSPTTNVTYATSYSGAGTTGYFAFAYANRNKYKVEGATGYYALTSVQWEYLISKRPNAANLIKDNVTVGTHKGCLIIAPDDFTDTLAESYTLEEVNALGLLCLPPAGSRWGDEMYAGVMGFYWTSTSDSSFHTSYSLVFGTTEVNANNNMKNDNGHAIRLVK